MRCPVALGQVAELDGEDRRPGLVPVAHDILGDLLTEQGHGDRSGFASRMGSSSSWTVLYSSLLPVAMTSRRPRPKPST